MKTGLIWLVWLIAFMMTIGVMVVSLDAYHQSGRTGFVYFAGAALIAFIGFQVALIKRG